MRDVTDYSPAASWQHCALRRREFLWAGPALGAGLLGTATMAADNARHKSVAAIVTVYRKNSHADVIVGKILKGWQHDGCEGPALRLASLFVDQFPDDDMSRSLSMEHRFPIAKSIDDAITLGTNTVAVDGVLSIGEHGDYPWNEYGQHLYPRRRFFDAITRTFQRCQQVVPVFNDKHPGPVWADALWMYRRAKELRIPWMAGSSLPVSFRDPDIALPLGAPLASCLASWLLRVGRLWVSYPRLFTVLHGTTARW